MKFRELFRELFVESIGANFGTDEKDIYQNFLDELESMEGITKGKDYKILEPKDW